MLGLVGLHASFTVSDRTIREAGELCSELDAKSFTSTWRKTEPTSKMLSSAAMPGRSSACSSSAAYLRARCSRTGST